MPAPRITFEHTVWLKLQTQASKKENLDLKTEMANATKTEQGNGNLTVWEPTKTLVNAAARVLEREKSFLRKPDSVPSQRLLKQLDALKKHALYEAPENASQKNPAS
jgi:hypothetical protein